jgi:Putative peptidoglycan binding domain
VGESQAYLSRFGWLRLPDQVPLVAAHDRLPEVQRGYFDAATEYGLAEFQRFYRLPVTADLNAETLALMRLPRCGVPDEPYPVATGPDLFVAGSTKWSNLHVRY